jgi:hypothetical protein
MSETFPALSHTTTELASGIFEHRFETAFENARAILDQVSADNIWYLIVNQKRFGERQVPGWAEEVVGDLFANAPPEIQETESLFVGKFHRDSVNAEELTRILASDSMTLVSSKLAMPEFLEMQKLAWAWFSRSSILHQQLVHGSKNLAKTLFAGIHHAMIVDRSTSDILICGFHQIPDNRGS